MVEFFKKAYANKDLVLSSIHADLYDGKQPTANVGGGRKEQAYLARYTIPSNPSFGSAELSRIDYNVYINSIELARNVYSFPEAAVYKTKDASRITLTEGMQKVDKEATNNTVIFTSHIAGFISIGDSFDGTGKAYGAFFVFQIVLANPDCPLDGLVFCSLINTSKKSSDFLL